MIAVRRKGLIVKPFGGITNIRVNYLLLAVDHILMP